MFINLTFVSLFNSFIINLTQSCAGISEIVNVSLFKDPPKKIDRFEAVIVESWRICFAFDPPKNDGGEAVELYRISCTELSRKPIHHENVDTDDEDEDSNESIKSLNDDDMYEYIPTENAVDFELSKDLNNGNLEIEVDSLSPAVYYDFVLSSCNKVGWTEAEDQSKIRMRTSSAPPSAMEAPIPLRTTCHSIAMAWKMPKRDNGERILSFEMQCRRASGGIFRTVCTPPCVIFEFNLQKLKPDEGYKFRIRSKNVCGWSEWSPDTNKICSNAAAVVKDWGSRFMHLTWKQPYINRIRFRGTFEIQRKRILRKREIMRIKFLRDKNRIEEAGMTIEELGQWVPSGVSKEDDPQHIVENLLPATKFIYRIRPITTPETPWGDGIECDEISTDMDCPDAPKNVSLGEISDTTIELLWDKAYDNGLAVEMYEIYLSYKGEDIWHSACRIDDITNAVVSNLIINTYYDFKIRAYNECGWGSFSSILTKRTRAITAPTPPTVDLKECGDTFVRIEWTGDIGKCDYQILKWHVQYSECDRVNTNDSKKWLDATPSGGEVPGDCFSILVVPLKAVTNYVFRMRGWGGETGDWSTFSAKSKVYHSSRRY